MGSLRQWFKGMGPLLWVSLVFIIIVLPFFGMLLVKNFTINDAQEYVVLYFQPFLIMFSVLWPMYILNAFLVSEDAEVLSVYREGHCMKKWILFLIAYCVLSLLVSVFYIYLQLIEIKVVFITYAAIVFINGIVYAMMSLLRDSTVSFVTTLLYNVFNFSQRDRGFPLYMTSKYAPIDEVFRSSLLFMAIGILCVLIAEFIFRKRKSFTRYSFD